MTTLDYLALLALAIYVLVWTLAMSCLVFADHIAALERRIVAWFAPKSPERQAWEQRPKNSLRDCSMFIGFRERVKE